MSTSDFLTLLGLAMAAWAFIAIEERKFILLFFSNLELCVGIFFLVFIHYLMAFDWLRENWFPGLKIFVISGSIAASVWAYIMALVLIAYPIINVNFGYFSRSRLKNLMKLYRNLIDQNNIDRLANYIIKFHLADIQMFLQQYSHIPRQESLDFLLRRNTESDKAYDNIISKTRMRFAASVYWNIVTHEEFVRKAANSYPELFAGVIKGMESRRASNRDFVQLYLNTLFESKNQELIGELKALNGARDSIQDRVEHIDLPILEGLMVNTTVAADNYVWYPIGKGAIKSLRHEEEQLEFLRRKYDEQLQNELWQQKIYIAIIYFNYMVRETIYRDSGWHMWLFHYHDFVRGLINNIPDESECTDSEHCSFNHFLIKEIINNIRDWLDLAADQNAGDRWIDSLRCLGKILSELAGADEQRIAFKLKADLFESVISQYFTLSNHQHSERASSIMKYMEDMFKNPGNPDWHEVEVSSKYREIMAAAWEEFDQVPYERHEDNGSISRFKHNVLDPLQIMAE